MKNIFVLLIITSLFIGCNIEEKEYFGTVVSKDTIDVNVLTKIFYGVPEGVLFSVKDTFGVLHFFCMDQYQSHLINIDDQKYFIVGEYKYGFSYNEFIDGKKTKIKCQVYELESYSDPAKKSK